MKFTHLKSVDFRLKLSLRDGRAILYVGASNGDVVAVNEPSGEFAMRGADDEAGDPDVAPDGTYDQRSTSNCGERSGCNARVTRSRR